MEINQEAFAKAHVAYCNEKAKSKHDGDWIAAAIRAYLEHANKHPDIAKGWPCEQITVEELLKRTQHTDDEPYRLAVTEHNNRMNRSIDGPGIINCADNLYVIGTHNHLEPITLPDDHFDRASQNRDEPRAENATGAQETGAGDIGNQQIVVAITRGQLEWLDRMGDPTIASEQLPVSEDDLFFGIVQYLQFTEAVVLPVADRHELARRLLTYLRCRKVLINVKSDET